MGAEQHREINNSLERYLVPITCPLRREQEKVDTPR